MIRYCIIQGSMWVSLKDVLDYLVFKEAISAKSVMKLYHKFKVANTTVKGDTWSNHQEYVQVKFMDPFYHWVCFERLYQLVSPKDYNNVKATRLIQAIDLADIQSIEECYPKLKGVFVECTLSLTTSEVYSN